MRNSSSDGTLRSSIPSIRARLLGGGVRVLGADDDVAARRVPRAAISAASVEVDAVSSMWPCQPAGRPSSCATQSQTSSSSSVEAGAVRQRKPTEFSVAASSSARIPGSAPLTAKYAKKRGCCQWVTPGRRISSRSRSTASNGSGCSGGDCRQPRADLARLDLREHRQLADALEVVGRPVDGAVPVLAERHFFALTFDQGRVFTTWSFVSHARRAMADAELHVAERRGRVRVGGDDDPHAALARQARVGVAQVEPVGLGVDLERGAGLDRGREDALEVDVHRRRAC